MPVRERSLDRSEAIALFEDVHAKQLVDAYNALHRMPKGSYWRIALRERLPPLLLDEDAICDQTLLLIDVRLDWGGKMLELADEAGRRSLDSWEERNRGLLPWHFSVPLFTGDDTCPSQG
jgi:hypothetical protein